MNIKGSGVTYYKDSHSDELRLFEGGLRNVAAGQNQLEYGRNTPKEHEDFLSYMRGYVTHSRSPNTQFMNFHYMLGGPKKFVFQRFLYNNFYKRQLRVAWLPLSVMFTLQCIGMRMYDNAGYDFFYFSD